MEKKAFISIGIFWAVILVGFIGLQEFTLRTGEEILLKTVPIDPRDLFRGDYVVLRYEISEVDPESLFYEISDFRRDDKVYALLDVDHDKIGTLASIDKDKPSEGIFIEGVVRRIYDGKLHIEYGIESYFVPEGRGIEIEKDLGTIYTKVVVDKSGNAVIKSLVLDGEDITFD